VLAARRYKAGRSPHAGDGELQARGAIAQGRELPLAREADSYIRFRLEVLRLLLEWRRVAKIIAKAAREVLGGQVEVYAFGGAVEGRLTADSDLDIALVVPRRASEARIIAAILKRAEREGVPWWFPAELHLMTREEMDMLARGGARFVRIEP